MDKFLRAEGFSRSEVDQGLYTRWSEHGAFTLLSLYVDDMLMASTREACLTQLMERMKAQWPINDLGAPKSLLGIAVSRHRDAVTLSQEAAIDDLVQEIPKSRRSKLRRATVPMREGVLDELNKAAAASDVRSTKGSGLVKAPLRETYLTILGKLLDIARHTRPDVAYAVSVLSRFSACPSEKQMDALLQVVTYLKCTKAATLAITPWRDTLVKGMGIPVTVYADADYGGDKPSSMSASGVIVRLDGAPVEWASKRQPVVARSTCEAEYESQVLGIRLAMTYTNILSEMGFTPEVTAQCDNNAAMATLRDNDSSNATKHVRISAHFVRQFIRNGSVKVVRCASQDMEADVLTKSVGLYVM